MNSVFETGSPPPMRGKGIRIIWSKNHFRITPAYAGKSVQLRQCQGSSRDHPRLCGEKLTYPSCSAGSAGSPPPMRGKVYSPKPLSRYDGITPAYAGKSGTAPTLKRIAEDHPRLCGEKCTIFGGCEFRPGSPPPMRGKGAMVLSRSVSVGITPAYAGKSWIPITQFFNIQDHPRLCGEKFSVFMLSPPFLGSPPPMRGKAFFTFF